MKKKTMVKGLELRKLRIESGLTQKELAEKIGLTTLSISRAENKNTGGFWTLGKICKFFKVDIKDYLE